MVTKLIQHYDTPFDTIAYKYSVHSNKFQAPKGKDVAIEFRYDLSPISIVIKQASNLITLPLPPPPDSPAVGAGECAVLQVHHLNLRNRWRRFHRDRYFGKHYPPHFLCLPKEAALKAAVDFSA